jgi:uncharacterized membrane protein YphA (DoxX/SURF4 family)
MTSRNVTVVLRCILGLVFVAGPLGTALDAVPEPGLPPGAAALVAAFARSGYMLPLLWTTEIAAGVLLLFGIAVPFALVLLAPVIVNIFAFHLVLAPNGLPAALAIGALELALAWRHRDAFARLFVSVAGKKRLTGEARATPAWEAPS